MGWKYVMFKNKLGDVELLFPVIFPDKMVHADVFRALRRHQPGWTRDGVTLHSAGKIEHVTVSGLGGNSDTLKSEAAPGDDKAINCYSYMHGVL